MHAIIRRYEGVDQKRTTELTNKVKAVAERGVEAALGEPKQNPTDQSFGTRSS